MLSCLAVLFSSWWSYEGGELKVGSGELLRDTSRDYRMLRWVKGEKCVGRVRGGDVYVHVCVWVWWGGLRKR